jgi:predicted transcriptional regulator
MQRKQERPIWIRPDGTVRNGNRRLAMLKRMVSKGALGIEWVNAIILDDDEVDEHELFALEQREQLTEEFKVRYTDINLLLTLRDAAVEKGIDWADPESIDKIAGELQHIAEGDKSYAIVQLQAIRAMDAYLHDSSADGQYQKLLRQVERFRDVGKNLARIERDYPDDAADMLQLMFAAIRAGNPHGDIRAIRKLFLRNRKRYEKLLEDVRKAEAGWEAGEGKLADPQVTKGRDEDNDSESEPPGPVVPNYPAAKVSSYIKNAIDSLTASELDVLSSLSQVANRLRQATPPMVAEALSGPEHNAIEDALSEIAAWLAEIEKIKAGGQKPRRTVKRGGL